MPRTAPFLAALTTAALSATTMVAIGPAPTAAAAENARTKLDRRLHDSSIRESSGLARSNYTRGIVWTHNDSGDGNRIFGVGKDGRTKAELRLKGASARDWEDIASGPDRTLWVGDIGDNRRARNSISVYRITEPRKLGSRAVPATRYDLRYPDGAHDAEGLLVRPNGRVFVISKSSSGALYRAPKKLSTSRVNVMKKVGSVPNGVTAAAWRPGGGLVLTNYKRAFVYDRVNGTPRIYNKPDLNQGESAEFARSGARLLLGSEGRNSPVYSMNIG